LKIGEVGYEMLRSMYKRGLVYLRIPICDDDKFTIPPLEVKPRCYINKAMIDLGIHFEQKCVIKWIWS